MDSIEPCRNVMFSLSDLFSLLSDLCLCVSKLGPKVCPSESRWSSFLELRNNNRWYNRLISVWWACIDSHVLEVVESGWRGSKRTCDMSCLDDGTCLGWDCTAVNIKICFCGRDVLYVDDYIVFFWRWMQQQNPAIYSYPFTTRHGVTFNNNVLHVYKRKFFLCV
jgi:hypothetical protein